MLSNSSPTDSNGGGGGPQSDSECWGKQGRVVTVIRIHMQYVATKGERYLDGDS